MAKPSIFSRDYEKKMRRRKIKISVVVALVAVVTGILIYKFKIEEMDFSNVRGKLQAWVDSGNDNSDEKVTEEVQEETKPEPPKKTYIEAKINDKLTLKCEYKSENDKKEFASIENADGISYDISPNKQMIIVLDKDQNMQLINIDGKVTDVTKKEYISKKGDKFKKDLKIKENKDYLWHSQAKFMDDENIVYVSNLPYFGTAATNEYVWIYNIKDKKDTISWKTKGKDITIGKTVPKKGIEIKSGKNEYILDNKGTIVK
ncbi:MAG: hypothetical protein ACRCVJ_02220 [Clostridium sp.]|uniref:hypothetical protein n=1 Tax=Clostridium sp. TaxID=1506 RepID=UPI003F3F37A1